MFRTPTIDRVTQALSGAGFRGTIRENDGPGSGSSKVRVSIADTPFEILIGPRDLFIVRTWTSPAGSWAHHAATDLRNLIRDLQNLIDADRLKEASAAMFKWTPEDRSFLMKMRIKAE